MRISLTKKNQGFTIIEVMIVLAIAGLIMAIVFLAVPALQRSSRNTQRKTDVGSILSAVSEYASNNSGQIPAASGTFAAEFPNNTPSLSYYIAANVLYNYSAVARGSAPTAPAGTDSVTVFNYLKCSANAGDPANATARSIAVLFNVEGSGGVIPQCQES